MYQYMLLGCETLGSGRKFYHILDCRDRTIDVLTESEVLDCLNLGIQIHGVVFHNNNILVSNELNHKTQSNESVLKTAVCAIKDAQGGVYGVECYNTEAKTKLYMVCTSKGLLYPLDEPYIYGEKEGTYKGNPKTWLSCTYIAIPNSNTGLLEVICYNYNDYSGKMYAKYTYFALKFESFGWYIGAYERVYQTANKPLFDSVSTQKKMRAMYRKDALSAISQARRLN